MIRLFSVLVLSAVLVGCSLSGPVGLSPVDPIQLPPVPASAEESVLIEWTEPRPVLSPDPAVEYVSAGALPLADLVASLSGVVGLPVVVDVSMFEGDLSLRYSGPASGLLDAVSAAADVFWQFDGRTVTFSKTRHVDLRWPAVIGSAAREEIAAALEAQGVALSQFGDRLRLVVTPSQSVSVRGFLEEYRLSVVRTEYSLLRRSASDSQSFGVDPSSLSALVRESVETQKQLLFSGLASGFSASVELPALSLSGVVRAVKERSGYDSAEYLTVSAVSGASSSVSLGTQYPYVSETSFSTLGESSDSVSQSFSFAEVTDGLELEAIHTASAGHVRAAGRLRSSRVVEYVSMSTGTSAVSRPIVDRREIAYDSVSRLGEPYLVASFSAVSGSRSEDLGSRSRDDSRIDYAVVAQSTAVTYVFRLVAS